MAAEYVQRIGARIAARRVEQGLSQVDIARALPGKVDGSQVSRWERGLHRPGDDTLERLGEILDVPVSYFMADEPAKSETPDPFAPAGGDGQLDRIEAMLRALLRHAGYGLEFIDALGDPAAPTSEDDSTRPPSDDEEETPAEGLG